MIRPYFAFPYPCRVTAIFTRIYGAYLSRNKLEPAYACDENKKGKKEKRKKKGTSVLHRSFDRKKKNFPRRESYQTNLHIIIEGAAA